jgi:carbon-monoxide dehydrogenase medium subunit
MIPGSFDYHRPDSIEAAIALLNSLGEDARVVAGGHSLIPMMKLRLAVPEHLVDLQDISDLKGISIDGDTITIGAMTTQSELIASDQLAGACPIVRMTSELIADPQVRNVGTIGGNVANGDPGNDLPALMLALDASYVLQGSGGNREVAAREFYQAAYFTALDDGEILTAVRFATPAAGHGYAYEKQKRKIGDYATAGTAVLLTTEGGKCQSASVSLTNVGDTPLYAEAASQALVGTSLDDAAIAAAVDAAKSITDPAADGRGPKEFRTHLTGILVGRAIKTAAERAS